MAILLISLGIIDGNFNHIPVAVGYLLTLSPSIIAMNQVKAEMKSRESKSTKY